MLYNQCITNHFKTMKTLYSFEKVYSENFYYWHFKSKNSTAKVYFWIFENKVTLEDFQVLTKRKGYGTQLFLYVLKFLYRRGVKSFFISSRPTKEAQYFWKKMTNEEFTTNTPDKLIYIKKTIKLLSTYNE